MGKPILSAMLAAAALVSTLIIGAPAAAEDRPSAADLTPLVTAEATPEPAEADVPATPAPTAEPEETTPTTPEPRTGAEQIERSAPESLSADLLQESASATTVTSFTAGNIISDFNFFNSWAMTEPEIQAFLQAKVGTCLNSYCLAALRVDTPNYTLSFGTCEPYPGASGESAARIIYKVQRLCGLSAKVILTTLQKEQGLITDPDPTGGQLRAAMGMACPDTAPCDSAYSGFFSQVYGAARQLTWYSNPESSFFQSGRYAVGQFRAVSYHPDPVCGSSDVYIGNLATAALYYYTPYQPNVNALNAGWGASSDPCASYGNRNFWNFYNLWFGNPTTAPDPTVTRLAGGDRYETAVRISRSSFPGTAPIVYVTTGRNYPDALAAGAAAAHEGGPLLLVEPGTVPGSTLDELKRLAPSSIVLVGGPDAVSDAVATTLGTVAPVERLYGIDRYATARGVAAHAFSGDTRTAYLATGTNFPDALSASGAAGAHGAPVLLIDGRGSEVDPATLSVLASLTVTTVKIAGGESAISAGIETGLLESGFTVIRLNGDDRFRTSAAINQDAFPNPSKLYVATGMGFADALAGSAAAAIAGSPLYVTFPTCVNDELRTVAHNADSLVLLGGAAALSDQVAYLAVC